MPSGQCIHSHPLSPFSVPRTSPDTVDATLSRSDIVTALMGAKASHMAMPESGCRKPVGRVLKARAGVNEGPRCPLACNRHKRQ